MTFDIRSAKVRGAQSSGRARIIWLEGRLIGFNKEGKIFDVEAEKPLRRPGYIRAWDSVTQAGVVHIDETCWTCNGWLVIAMKSIEELIGEQR